VFKRSKNRDSRLQAERRGERRRLRFEHFESRRLLDGKVDIVFMVDESGSGANESLQEWLSQLVAGVDGNNNGDRTETGDELSLAEKFANSTVGIDDVQYGVVGFGEHVVMPPNDPIDRFAHSQLTIADDDSSFFIDADPAGPDGILGTSDDLSTADLHTIFSANTAEQGGKEDGWDAIEHAIAEYEIRDDAVPVFVLLQGEEGRINLNESLTRRGIRDALASKNAILNVMTVGDNVLAGPNDPNFEEGEATFDWDALIDLGPYGMSADIRILGVEADDVDGVDDGQHSFHYVDIEPTNSGGVPETPTATQSNALQISYNGSNTGDSGLVATGKSVLIGQNVVGGIGADSRETPTSTEQEASPLHRSI
jgi:hypothetical protein